MKKLASIFAVGGLLALGGAVMAQGPVENISAAKHPNLAAAQKHLKMAYQSMLASQKANDYDMQGHAKKAEELITEASNELKLAAEEANKATPKK